MKETLNIWQKYCHSPFFSSSLFTKAKRKSFVGVLLPKFLSRFQRTLKKHQKSREKIFGLGLSRPKFRQVENCRFVSKVFARNELNANFSATFGLFSVWRGKKKIFSSVFRGKFFIFFQENIFSLHSGTYSELF